MTVAVARARAAAVGARGAETGGGRRGACELERRPAPDEVSAPPRRPPRGLRLADRAGGTPGGPVTRGRPGRGWLLPRGRGR